MTPLTHILLVPLKALSATLHSRSARCFQSFRPDEIFIRLTCWLFCGMKGSSDFVRQAHFVWSCETPGSLLCLERQRLES